MSDSAAKTADPAPRRALLGPRAGIIALAAVAAVVVAGRFLQAGGGFDLEAFMGAARHTPWAPFLTLGVFIVLGQTGFPQFLMIGAAVMVFGPVWGFALSWTGTMISSSIGFLLGHLFGGELLQRFGGARLNGVSERLGRHGIAAVIVLRNVPAGPFVAVNMMAGLSHISYRKFVIGTALGILPKMTFIAFLGASFEKLLQERSILAIAAVAALIAVWVGVMVWMRRKAGDLTDPAPAPAAPAEAGIEEARTRDA